MLTLQWKDSIINILRLHRKAGFSLFSLYSWAGLNLQEGIGVTIELITYFHDYIMAILFIILGFVCYIFYVVASSKMLDKYVVESHLLELIWTLVPILILLFIAFPSLYLLYLTEDTTSRRVSVKVIGHQWYWEYQYDNPSLNKTFDSYITTTYSKGLLRNLDVDNRLALPTYLSSLLLITSADVLHSWTVPILGVKADAIPGRLNYVVLTPSSSGVFYGQCSELCGSNHSFIPIVVESLDYSGFISFILQEN